MHTPIQPGWTDFVVTRSGRQVHRFGRELSDGEFVAECGIRVHKAMPYKYLDGSKVTVTCHRCIGRLRWA